MCVRVQVQVHASVSVRVRTMRMNARWVVVYMLKPAVLCSIALINLQRSSQFGTYGPGSCSNGKKASSFKSDVIIIHYL